MEQLLNKVAGVYGLIAVFTGGSFAQLSMYIYSVGTLIALIWALRAVADVRFLLLPLNLFAYDVLPHWNRKMPERRYTLHTYSFLITYCQPYGSCSSASCGGYTRHMTVVAKRTLLRKKSSWRVARGTKWLRRNELRLLSWFGTKKRDWPLWLLSLDGYARYVQKLTPFRQNYWYWIEFFP